MVLPVPNGEERVYPIPNPDDGYTIGSRVTQGAYPEAGGYKIAWDGVDTGKDTIASVRMDRDRNVVVVLTLGMALPVPTPVAAAVPVATSVYLVATATPAYHVIAGTLGPAPQPVPTAVPVPVGPPDPTPQPAGEPAHTPTPTPTPIPTVSPSTVVATDVPKNFPNPGQVSSTLSFPTSGPILDMTLEFRLTHACGADLEIDFIGPNGGRVVVMRRGGGSCTGAPATIASINDTLAGFFGELQAAGTWTLTVDDDSPGHTGTLDYWSLDITVGPG